MGSEEIGPFHGEWHSQIHLEKYPNFDTVLTKDTILEVLRKRNALLVELGVERIGLFGSYAKGTAVAASDVDIFVEMPANFTNLCKLYNTLEKEFKVKVDIVRYGEHLRQSFLDTINKEILYA